jgi:hypothetical protein
MPNARIVSAPRSRAARAVLSVALLLAIAATASCSGSAPTAKGSTACSDPLMIDDMEDGDGAICPFGGRSGSWYTVGDGPEGTLSPSPGATFTMSPIPGGRGDSQMAARMLASGFNSGAAMGVGLGEPYDASATAGITFWMKTNAPGVGVHFETAETVPVSGGGLCADTATTYNCGNAYEFFITSPHPDWFQYYVPWSALFLAGFKPDASGNILTGSAAWDPTRLMGIGFSIGPVTNAELWIDDLGFYDCSNEACLPTCTDPALPVACPALGAFPADCWPAGTDCATVTTPPKANSALVSVWGSGPDDVWAVGPVLAGSPATVSATMLHWDGSIWSSAASGTTHPLWGVWGSGADDVWAVGDFGTVDHWNGTAWSASSAGLIDSLDAVWGSGADDVWAAGANGAIVHWDGTTWSVPTSVSPQTLYRLWGSGPTDVWAVGDAGTILHWDGTAWSASASGTSSALWGVWGSGSSDVYAVGNTAIGDATILHWDGAAWSTVSTPADGYANTVSGSGPDDVWVVGNSILHFDGATWSTVASPSTYFLEGAWGTGPDDAWIVGAGSTILHWDGTAWSAGRPLAYADATFGRRTDRSWARPR